MKKRISLFIATALAVVALPAAAFAASGFTDVSGTVTDGGVSVGKGITVTVKCNGNVLTDKTDKSGTYFVQFTKKECKKNSTITVTTSKYKGVKGKATGTATKDTNKLNVALINVSVPEYGLIGLAGATVIGGAAFLAVRRRQLSGHQA